MDKQAPDLAHLRQICTRCGHGALAHWHVPHCTRACDCRLDPVCNECGELTSKHEPKHGPGHD